MKCDQCQIKQATHHIHHIVNGQSTEQHLCADCAHQQSMGMKAASTTEEQLFEHFFQAPFGWMADEPTAVSVNRPKTCPRCGYTWSMFKKVARMGCTECYETFRDQITQMLGSFQSGSQHVGRTLGQGSIFQITDRSKMGEQPKKAEPADAADEKATTMEGSSDKVYSSKADQSKVHPSKADLINAHINASSERESIKVSKPQPSERKAELLSLIETLRLQQKQAIEAEDYQRAAQLRDQIKAHMASASDEKGAPV